MSTEHVSDDDLLRYCFGALPEEELAPVEEHILWCDVCLTRAEEALEYVDSIRRVLSNEIEAGD